MYILGFGLLTAKESRIELCRDLNSNSKNNHDFNFDFSPHHDHSIRLYLKRKGRKFFGNITSRLLKVKKVVQINE